MRPNPTDLRTLRLFQSLDNETLEQLRGVARKRTAGDDELIVLEGDESPIFGVVSGSVQAFRINVAGRKQTLHHLPAGAVFNLPAAFASRTTAPACVRTTSASILIEIPREELRRLAARHSLLALAVLRDLADKLHHFTELTHDLSLRDVKGRLARFLLRNARNEQPQQAWTQEAIATEIGTVREVVSRALRSMIRSGWISMKRGQIVVLDPDRLEELAG